MKILAKIQYNAPVVLTFTLLSFGVYLWGILTQGVSTTFIFSNYRTSFLDPLQYIRLFSHVLGHANWMHYSSNFIIILMIGPMLEEKYTSRVLLLLIAITALVTGLVHTLLSDTILLGASGVVYMFIILSSFANVKEGRIPLTLIIVFFIFIGKEFFSGAIVQDNISQLSHILGGLCGGFFAFKVKVRN